MEERGGGGHSRASRQYNMSNMLPDSRQEPSVLASTHACWLHARRGASRGGVKQEGVSYLG